MYVPLVLLVPERVPDGDGRLQRNGAVPPPRRHYEALAGQERHGLGRGLGEAGVLLSTGAEDIHRARREGEVQSRGPLMRDRVPRGGIQDRRSLLRREEIEDPLALSLREPNVGPVVFCAQAAHGAGGSDVDLVIFRVVISPLVPASALREPPHPFGGLVLDTRRRQALPAVVVEVPRRDAEDGAALEADAGEREGLVLVAAGVHLVHHPGVVDILSDGRLDRHCVHACVCVLLEHGRNRAAHPVHVAEVVFPEIEVPAPPRQILDERLDHEGARQHLGGDGGARHRCAAGGPRQLVEVAPRLQVPAERKVTRRGFLDFLLR
mmetsp:Transcript_775/g.2256  ORF Transcript_775/g.2256 Transcript_775/m.2256 type:complete len:322 (+) Transcript_775:61-1026(+)